MKAVKGLEFLLRRKSKFQWKWIKSRPRERFGWTDWFCWVRCNDRWWKGLEILRESLKLCWT